ncbi:MAG TPA: TetR/AcrR family transcriptional regulator [Clostridia bacterium]|nr:TetR/AcrR family transcriptional regulator [Clostridia bacterium]
MDRRQKRTKDAIFAAFGALLAKRSFAQITVQDIIDEANVGRSTFYTHFETKDDLLKEMCTNLFEHVVSETLNAELSHDFSSAEGNAEAIITHILYHLRDEKKNIIAMLTYESNELFLRYFREYLSVMIREYLLTGDTLLHQNVPESFLVNHISSAFVGMVQWWISCNLEQTPEELAGYFFCMLWSTPAKTSNCNAK